MAQTIGALFDPSKDIYRKIETVVQYENRDSALLKAEISEYQATPSIERQLEKLVDDMEYAMSQGGREVGVWVSGFYGSGKSSLTKYFGFALDEGILIDGVSFREHFLNRISDQRVRARVNTVIKKYPAAVVMVNLSTEMSAGPALEPVTNVLYYKVLRWAGYSRNLKIAAFQRKVQQDGRELEFKAKIQDEFPELTWEQIQNDPLVIEAVVPRVAHEMYPKLFSTPAAFSVDDTFVTVQANERVAEMLEMVRRRSGKELIVFIVDEVGQYVSARSELIHSMQGLAESLKELGKGKAWIFATAQQTLTEDDRRAALNSPELFKLNARFPIKVNLESSDIKEICYRRLLGKSRDGEKVLEKLFVDHGPELKQNTKLQDAKYYEADFTREWFVKLYPFLPGHFEILLQLLSQLQKSTGGIGLRSAIKVIQDILIESEGGDEPVAKKTVGWLATTVTLYDALSRDIQRAERSIYDAVQRTLVQYPNSPLHRDIAKSIAILQILKNMPVTRTNVASLMHPSVTSPSRHDEVAKAIDAMVANPLSPLGEEEGSLKFLSEKVRDIEKQRGELVLRGMEVRRHLNDALRNVFERLPHTSEAGGVTAGLKVQSMTGPLSLANDKNPIQIVVEFVEPSQLETTRNRLVTESTSTSAQNTITLLARSDADADAQAEEIYRSEQIAELCKSDPDEEVRSYRNGQLDTKAKYEARLRETLRKTLSNGTFFFRGGQYPVGTLDQDHRLDKAAEKILTNAAREIYDRYDEAPLRVETATAEKFLRTDLKGMTTTLDPLGLVEVTAQQRRISSNHKAIVSVRDWLAERGTVEGKRILEHFSDPPFGWSNDTTRYVLAAMLVGGELSMNVSGTTVTAPGQKAIDALKTNKSFSNVGLSLRSDRPSNEMLGRAAKRLTELTGDAVLPLEPEITKAAVTLFKRSQGELGWLSERLAALQVGGESRARSLVTQLTDALLTDASDATQRLGGNESQLYDDLRWARAVKQSLEQGLGSRIRELADHCSFIASLPSAGVPGALKHGVQGVRESAEQRLASDDFHQRAADLGTSLTELKTQVAQAASNLADQQRQRVEDAVADLTRLPDWQELTQEEQANVVRDLEASIPEKGNALHDLKRLMNHEIAIHEAIDAAKRAVKRAGEVARQKRIEAEVDSVKDRQRGPRTVTIPAVVRSTEELDRLISELQTLREQLSLYTQLEMEVEE